MARFVSFSPFNTKGTPGAGGLTLDALMKRQELLAKNATQLPEAQDMRSPWQGAAYLANVLGDKVNQGRAESNVAATRDALAKVTAGIDYDAGPTSEQIAQVQQYDPDLAQKLLQQKIDRSREQRGYEQQNLNREDQQSFQASQQQETFTHADTSREDTQQAQVDAAALAETNRIEEEKRKAAAGAKRIVSGDEAKQLGGDPARQYTVSEDGTTLTDITPDKEETFRPPTPQEIIDFKLDPQKPFRVSNKTGKPEAIGSDMQLLTPEAAGRLGMADEFINRFDEIHAMAKNGDLTGLWDYAKGVTLGRGPAGDAARVIASGADSLLRALTGAGMPASEAEKYVQRYQPAMLDNADTLASKIENLKTDLLNTRARMTAGRNVPGGIGGSTPPPAATGIVPGRPDVTEEDITFNMQKYGLTREQVIQRLTKQGGG